MHSIFEKMAPRSFRSFSIIVVSALGFVGLLTFLGFIYETFSDKNNQDDEEEQTVEQSTDQACIKKPTNEVQLDKTNSSLQGELTPSQIEYLLGLIDRVDENTLGNLLVTLSNCCAFTRNQNLLRENGGLNKLIQLLHHEKDNVRLRTIQTLSNLAMNLENQKHIAVCTPILLQVINSAQIASNNSNEEELVAALQLLVNLSVVDTWQAGMTECVASCFDLLEMDSLSTRVKMNSLRLLVNLSCNQENVELFMNDQMLVLGKFMDPTMNEDIILRTLGLILNIVKNADKVLEMKERTLPQEIHQKLNELQSSKNEEIREKVMKIKTIYDTP